MALHKGRRPPELGSHITVPPTSLYSLWSPPTSSVDRLQICRNLYDLATEDFLASGISTFDGTYAQPRLRRVLNGDNPFVGKLLDTA
jgi:hypothetical protein